MAITMMTLEEFLHLPDDGETALEFTFGEVVAKPMGDVPHSAIQGYMMVLLYQYLLQSGIGRAFPELRCILGPPGRTRVYVPDLFWVAKERLPSEQYLYVAADLVVEVLSPDENRTRFMAKILIYLHQGVRQVWVIDPDSETILVLTPGDSDERTLTAGAMLDGGDVLPRIQCASRRHLRPGAFVNIRRW